MKTHCKNRHRFNKENTYFRPDGARGCRKCLFKAVRKYRDNNPEKVKTSSAKSRDKTREERKQYARQYCKNHPEKYAAYQSKRRALRTQAGGAYTVEQWISLCSRYGNVCLCCGEADALTPDHVIPIALGGTSDISNIQPLCLPCNLRKHTRTTDYRKLRRC